MKFKTSQFIPRIAVSVLVLAGSLAGVVRSGGQAVAEFGPTVSLSDVERDVRQRFGYWEKDFPYSAEAPSHPVVYSEVQKQTQREAAKAMIMALTAAATNAGSHGFTIPPAIYRIEPGQIQLQGVSDFTLRASGVELIVDSEKSGPAFTFVGCTNVTLTGRSADGAVPTDGKALLIDSEQLPMSVARILSVNPKAEELEVEILPGYCIDLPAEERMMAYDTKGRLLNFQQMGWKSLTPLGERKFRLKTPALKTARNCQEVLVAGHLLALHSNPHHTLRTHSVFANRNCKDMTFESIRVCNGGGAPADHRTAGHTIFRDWQLYPRPGTSRLPIATGLGQFSKDGGSFVFENCAFGPHLDDGINLLSTMSMVGKLCGEKALIVAGGKLPTVGSTLSFFSYTNWVALAEAKVVASEPVSDEATLAAVNAFAKANRTVPNGHHAYRTVLDRAVKLEPFAMVVHSDYRADSIVVRGCLFRDQLAQIMLLQGVRSGLIESNLLLRSTGGGVSAQFSQYWWEGPMPEHLVIRRNVFRDNPVAAAVNGFGGNGAVAVYAGTQYPTEARLLHHFLIEENLIINPSVYGIVVRNADDVIIRRNHIINPGACEVTGLFRGRPVQELYAAICLDAVSQTEVTDNVIEFGSPRCQRAVLMEPNCDAATVRVEHNREMHAAERK